MSKHMGLDLSLPMGSIEAYQQKVSAIPVLSAAEERALAVRLREHNDLDAARELVLSHLRFVAYVARGYRGYGLPEADLIQEGNVGLMKAVKRFNPDMNVRLASFAVHWIKAEIHEYVLRNWRIVKVATTKAQRKLFFNLRKAKKRLGWFSQEEINAVAKDLNVTPENVMEMEARLNSHDTSFEMPVGESDDESFSPAAYLTDQRPCPASEIEHQQLALLNQGQLQSALGELDERSLDILQQRWLSEEKVTLKALSEKYGVSVERIRQLESNAIKRLKGVMVA